MSNHLALSALALAAGSVGSVIFSILMALGLWWSAIRPLGDLDWETRQIKVLVVAALLAACSANACLIWRMYQVFDRLEKLENAMREIPKSK